MNHAAPPAPSNGPTGAVGRAQVAGQPGTDPGGHPRGTAPATAVQARPATAGQAHPAAAGQAHPVAARSATVSPAPGTGTGVPGAGTPEPGQASGLLKRTGLFSRRKRSARLPTAWPMTALFVLYPLWWALGLPAFIFIILAVPMAVQLWRRGTVRVPPGFGLWLILVLWVAVSVVMMDLVAPDTLAPSGSGRYIGWIIRVANYVSLTVIMLYVLNLSERELPRKRVVRLFGFMAVVTVIGGYVGALLPHLRFVAPLNYLLPSAIAKEPFVSRLMHVEVAQVQDVIEGQASTPRPAAPFEYTNTWGENIAILLIWFVVGWVVLGGGLRRIGGYLVVLAAIFPIVYSLNRGVWISVAIAAVYVAFRMALRGRILVLAGLALGAAAVGIMIIVSPLGNTLTDRMENGHSDDIRSTLSTKAVEAANHSPVLGYGANRALIGSNRSIAIGKSAECAQCGNRELGSNGQLWSILVGQGWVGAFCYNAFFLWCLWRFRHDHTPIGIAGSLVLILMLFFQFLYGALNTTLAYGLISVALLARNDLHLRELARGRSST